MPRSNLSFGNYLRELIKEAGITQYIFYSKAEIAKPYFYEILSGKVSPPPYHQQQKFANVLKLDDHSRQILFNLAAKERNEIPGDITEYVSMHPECIEQIRNTIKLTSGQ